MARETRDQRAEREAVARDNEWNEFVDKYSARLHALMYAYLNTPEGGFVVTKVDDETYEFGRTDYFEEVVFNVTPPVSYDWECLNAMDQCEQSINDWKHEVAEVVRKRKVKEAALTKLTAEERELLGLV